MTENEWVKAAMLNDSMVVELLLGLNHEAVKPKPDFPLEWTVRQRRSRPPKKAAAAAATRDSPTTPLSWSGGTSVSCGGGAEESSCPPPPTTKATANPRSKLNGTSEKSTTKKSRRKKTLAELKEDEIMLLRERRNLKKELAMLRANLETQRATNENLKRMKLDMQPQPASKRDVTLTCDLFSPSAQQNSACNAQLPQPYFPSNFSAEQETKFALPDLNIPIEVDLHI